ncbi:MFS transporter [Kineosporia sp. J2-2]|uniref:MFS transporter n=1 Tax=Kineosporia corallincola TaxID=2835133 RepID=A0ABS5TR93_9ACTN|nr:MFS transporter [Kineosporia corallincola]
MLGEAASVVGDQVWFVALSWAAVQVASPATAGLILTVSAVPRLVLMILGGPLADRYDARRLMIGSDLLRAAVMFAAAAIAVQHSSVMLLVVISLVFGAADAIFMPASGSLRPRLLHTSQLASGGALRELAMRAALTLGSPLGGLVVAAGNLWLACVVNGFTFLVSMLFLRTVRPREVAPAAPGAPTGYFASLKDGLRYLATHPVLRSVLTVTLLVNLAFVGPMNVGLALLSQDRDWGAGGIGTLLAGFGVGAAAGALAMLRTHVDRGIGLWIALACLLEGAGLAALGLIERFPVAVAAAALVGLVSAPLGIMTTALTQSGVPDEYRGRVSSVNMLVNLGLTPLSIAALGVVADWWGTSTAVVAFAALAWVAAVLCLMVPALRRARVRGEEDRVPPLVAGASTPTKSIRARPFRH